MESWSQIQPKCDFRGGLSSVVAVGNKASLLEAYPFYATIFVPPVLSVYLAPSNHREHCAGNVADRGHISVTSSNIRMLSAGVQRTNS